MLFYTTPKTKKYEEKKEHFSKNIFYNETCENLNTNEKKRKIIYVLEKHVKSRARDDKCE